MQEALFRLLPRKIPPVSQYLPMTRRHPVRRFLPYFLLSFHQCFHLCFPVSFHQRFLPYFLYCFPEMFLLFCCLMSFSSLAPLFTYPVSSHHLSLISFFISNAAPENEAARTIPHNERHHISKYVPL